MAIGSQPVSSARYIPSPDEFTLRNKMLQTGAALGMCLGGGILLRSILKGGVSQVLSEKALVISTLVSTVVFWALRQIDSLHFTTQGGEYRVTLLQHIHETTNEKVCRKLFKLLFWLGANPNARDSKADAILHYCRDIPMMKQVIERGADVNARGHLGCVPLHSYCYHGQLDQVRLVIEHGAQAHYQMVTGHWTGKSPLDLAIDEKTMLEKAKRMDEVARQNEIIDLLRGATAGASA